MEEWKKKAVEYSALLDRPKCACTPIGTALYSSLSRPTEPEQMTHELRKTSHFHSIQYR